MTSDEAYQVAEQRIREARLSEATKLDLRVCKVVCVKRKKL